MNSQMDGRAAVEMQAVAFPQCPVCYAQFDASSWKQRRKWQECIHFVCAACAPKVGRACPLCRRGAQPGSRQRDHSFPIKAVINQRNVPKDDRNLTLAHARKRGRKSEQEWWAYAKVHLVHSEMTKEAQEDPDVLGNRMLYTVRTCKRHGDFVSREDMQRGCLNCAQSERRTIDVSSEPLEFHPTKRRKTSGDAWVHEGLAELSESDCSSYSDLIGWVDCSELTSSHSALCTIQ